MGEDERSAAEADITSAPTERLPAAQADKASAPTEQLPVAPASARALLLPRLTSRQRWLFGAVAALVALALLGGGAAVGARAGAFHGSPLSLAWFARAT